MVLRFALESTTHEIRYPGQVQRILVAHIVEGFHALRPSRLVSIQASRARSRVCIKCMFALPYSHSPPGKCLVGQSGGENYERNRHKHRARQRDLPRAHRHYARREERRGRRMITETVPTKHEIQGNPTTRN